MPSDIPPPINEPLNTYLAIQLRTRNEPAHIAIEAFCRAAKALGILFRRLELLDTISIGTGFYVRFRTDLTGSSPVLDKLYKEGRGVVSVTAAGKYIATIPGGRIGQVSHLVMHAIPKLGQGRMYRGPKMKMWERQFDAA